jgi:hypothetical protein
VKNNGIIFSKNTDHMDGRLFRLLIKRAIFIKRFLLWATSSIAFYRSAPQITRTISVNKVSGNLCSFQTVAEDRELERNVH